MPLPDNFYIRPAVNEESDKIKNLIFSILEEYGLSSDPQSTDKDLEDIESSYTNNNGIFDIVVNSHGKIVATTGIFKIDEDTCELRKMYLLREYRGMGIGKALLDHSIDAAKQLGYQRIILETASVLKEAIGLYEKYGFAHYEPDHLSSRCDQTYYLNINGQSE